MTTDDMITKINDRLFLKEAEMRKLHQESEALQRQIAYADGYIVGLRTALDMLNKDNK